MKTILTLSVGFWLGRQIYINYGKREALQKEAHLKKRLTDFLERQNFSQKEQQKHSKQIIRG